MKSNQTGMPLIEKVMLVVGEPEQCAKLWGGEPLPEDYRLGAIACFQLPASGESVRAVVLVPELLTFGTRGKLGIGGRIVAQWAEATGAWALLADEETVMSRFAAMWFPGLPVEMVFPAAFKAKAEEE